jgi:hypothetical protein
MKNYFTFGLGQQALSKTYVEIEAESRQAARDLMFENFGTKWAFQYNEKEFLPQIKEWGYTKLITISE